MLKFSVKILNLDYEITVSDDQLLSYINALPDDERVYYLMHIELPDYRVDVIKRNIAAMVRQLNECTLNKTDILIMYSFFK